MIILWILFRSQIIIAVKPKMFKFILAQKRVAEAIPFMCVLKLMPRQKSNFI